jgi:hypothetical protein
MNLATKKKKKKNKGVNEMSRNHHNHCNAWVPQMYFVDRIALITNETKHFTWTISHH